MPKLDDILVFVKVVQFESLSKAARALDMPISTVSRKLSGLESDLGVSLVRRTTRRVAITSQGRDYFNQCVEPLTRLQEAERVLTQTHGKLEGPLTISVPMMLAQGPFLDFISGFLKAHAGIRIDLIITNTYVNLVADNIDVAIRFGHLQDSSVVALKIGRIVRHVVASPDYLGNRPLPAEPDDLKAYDCVMFNAKNNETDWDLVSGRKTVRVHVSGSVSGRDCQSVAGLVQRGHGVGLIETHYIEQARGDLVRLLPRWTSADVPVFAVYATRKFVPPRLSALLVSLADWKSPLWVRG